MSILYYTFKKVSKVFVFVLTLYSFFWYGIGQYVKTKLGPIFSESLNLSSFSYDNIDLSGYPFSFQYKINNLKIHFTDSNEIETILTTDKINIGVDILVKNINLHLADDVTVKSTDNKKNHIIKIHHSSSTKVVMEHSLLKRFLLRSELDTTPKEISYFDYGYDVFDDNLGKIGFVSKRNVINVSIKDNKKKAEKCYSVKADLHNQVGSAGEIEAEDHKLDADFEFRVAKKPGEAMSGFYIKFNQFDLNSNNYQMNIKGDLGHDLFTKTSLGNIDININHFDGFIKACSNFLYQNQVQVMKSMLVAMSDQGSKANIKNISFSVRGNESGLKYGNIGGLGNIIRFMMQAGDLDEHLLK